MSADRLARFVVRCYPRKWRTRYQDEVLALLDERPATSRDVVDLHRLLRIAVDTARFGRGC